MNAFWQSLLITPFLASFGCKSDGGLSAGDVAPDFLLKGSDGNSYQLSSYTGKKAVVLAWFPKAFTGGCTKQCKAIAESSAALKEYEAVYFTISCDPLEGKKGIVKFAESLSVDYPILSDSSKSVAEQYGVLGDVLPFPKRWTFYIGKNGRILKIDKSVKTGSSGDDIAVTLGELKVPKVNL
tara:strand:- start:563 stop:1108 length:546 start_codon:yes stop_codon:yes gene_type:complete